MINIKPEKIGELGQLYNGACLDVLRTLPSNSVICITITLHDMLDV